METYNNHSGQFFEVTVKGLTAASDGNHKTTKFTATMPACSYSRAEDMATAHFAPFFIGDFSIVKLARAGYSEVFTLSDDSAPKFFTCRLSVVVPDENTGRERRTRFVFLVQADSAKAAQRCIDEVAMRDTVNDYETCAISLSPVSEFFDEQTM